MQQEILKKFIENFELEPNLQNLGCQRQVGWGGNPEIIVAYKGKIENRI